MQSNSVEKNFLTKSNSKLKRLNKLNYSLRARRHLAPIEVQERFGLMMNYLMSFQGITVRHTWRYLNIKFKGETLLKFTIIGKTIIIYFKTDPRLFINKKVDIDVLYGERKHMETPFVFRVSNIKDEDYALRIFSKLLKMCEFKKTFKQKDYILPIKKIKELKLIKLIK